MAHRLQSAFETALAAAGLHGTASVTDTPYGIFFRFRRAVDGKGDEITCGGRMTEHRPDKYLVAFAVRHFKNVCESAYEGGKQ